MPDRQNMYETDNATDLHTEIRPVHANAVSEHVDISTEAVQPAHRGEVLALGKMLVQGPKHLNNREKSSFAGTIIECMLLVSKSTIPIFMIQSTLLCNGSSKKLQSCLHVVQCCCSHEIAEVPARR